jgi:hypothetical protein
MAADELDFSVSPMLSGEHQDTLLDALRLAIQQSVAIEFIGGSRLMREAGGIACLLTRQSAMHQSMQSGVAGSLGVAA